MFERLHTKLGRTHTATFDSAERQLKELMPPNFKIWDYNCLPELGEDQIPLKVVEINYNVVMNTEAHHTNMFKVTKTQSELDPLPLLIVRRGQSFVIDICFNQPFSSERDEILLTFQFGENSSVSKGSRITVSLNKGIKAHSWSAGVCKIEDTKLTIQILTPADCIIGKCSLAIDTKKLNVIRKNNDHMNGEQSFKMANILRYYHNDPIYILFNPWLKDDQVYLKDETLRNECVLSDTGKIFIGNYRQITAVPWSFAQFERTVLDCCLYLLDSTCLQHAARGNAVMIVRNISMMINSTDDGGIVMANWSGQYQDGTAPTQWVGSLSILQEFWKTKLPVKYGQCWVFAALATTICRCLGIPTRCVTNFSSAHDCDGTNAINMHWNFNGEPIQSMNSDSIWSFHVWNESFMARSDLPGSVVGWHAFDPTSQEASDGVYCAGPCSVQAVRLGEIFLCYDGALIFSELMTNRFHWVLQEDGSWKTILQKNITGKHIVTHATSDPFEKRTITDYNDITDQYKFAEGSEEERSALLKANTWATNTGIFDKGDGDVKVSFSQDSNVMAGAAFDVLLQLQNRSRFQRNVKVTLTLLSSYYTGHTKAKIKSQSFDVTLCSLKNHQIQMRVLAEDYAYVLTDHATFQICGAIRVAETKQLFVDCVDFCLSRPALEFEVPSLIRVGMNFECIIKMYSQMPIDLTECEWMIESLGLMSATKIPQKNLEPYAQVELKVPIIPQQLGRMIIMASFNSTQLKGITGSKEVIVVL